MKKIILGLLMFFVLGCTKDDKANETNTANLPSIKIGTQTWTTKNLDVRTYSDGTEIPQVTDPSQWENLTTGAWCYYENNPTNGTTYGKLYNWYAVAGIYDNDPNTPNKKLAPKGYHIPIVSEWTNLFNYLGGQDVAGGKMKTTGTMLWNSPNTGATNSSGFNGLPGGFRASWGRDFYNFGSEGYWWSSSEYSSIQTNYGRTTSVAIFLDFEGGSSRFDIEERVTGYSVRCLKD